MRRFENLVCNDVRARLYKAFILPYFQYCSAVWHFCGVSSSDKQELVRVSQGFGGTREHWQHMEGNKGTWAYFWEQGTETVQIRRRKHFDIRNKERYFWDFILFSPLVKYLGYLREFAITFGLHQKTQISVSLTLARAISRIQEVYDFDCRSLNQVKAFLGTTAQTQGPQDTVSTVVLEDVKRMLQALKEIKELLSQHVPQLLQEFEVKSLLTLIWENFFSEMRSRSYDIPLQLQFNFRFNSALKEHLKQTGRTKILLLHKCQISLPKSENWYLRCPRPHLHS